MLCYTGVVANTRHWPWKGPALALRQTDSHWPWY